MIDGDSGRIIDGRFELVERLGSGGMGTVWRARDLVLHRKVAVKQVRPLAPELALRVPKTPSMACDVQVSVNGR